MSAIITVQGTHTAWFDAERATVQVSAAFDGAHRDQVFARATEAAAATTALVEPLFDADRGPVTWWSSDRVHVWSDRPWNSDGKRLPLVYHAAIGLRAKFSDVDALARFIEQVAVTEGLSIGGIEWDLTEARRIAVTDEVRQAAVADAVHKAGVYAAAAGLGTPAVVGIADPGMLGDAGGGPGEAYPAPYERMTMKAQLMDAGGAPLTLSPEQIQVAASVDVRFAVEIT